MAVFERRYANGYNLYIDQDYVTWLQENHPESLPDDLQVSGSDVSGMEGGGGTDSSATDSSATFTDPDVTDPVPNVSQTETSTGSKCLTVSDSLAQTRQVFSSVTEFLTLPSPRASKKGEKPPGGGLEC